MMLYTPQDRIVTLGAGMQVHAQAPLDELVFLLKDEFTTTEAAPLAGPRMCEPGPGTLTITDTGNNLSISSGVLNYAARVSDTDPRIVSGSHARALGLTLYGKIKNQSYVKFGWNSSASALSLINAFETRAFTDFSVYFNGAVIPNFFGPLVGLTVYELAVILRTTGAYYLIRGGTFSNWTLLFVDAVASAATLYAWTSNTVNNPYTADSVRIFQAGAPFDSQYGIATNYVGSPAVGEITSQEADGEVEMTWTAVTGQTWNLYVRRTDDSNCWVIRCSQSGSTIKLIEINGGVEAERASNAQAFTNGSPYRIFVQTYGNTIRVSVNASTKSNYASASFNNTATGVKTDRAGSNLIAWPRTLSGAALAELESWTA